MSLQLKNSCFPCKTQRDNLNIVIEDFEGAAVEAGPVQPRAWLQEDERVAKRLEIMWKWGNSPNYNH